MSLRSNFRRACGWQAREGLPTAGFTTGNARPIVCGVRLQPEERAIIKAVVARRDPEARVYLFGSRADVKARGGDIDLLIDSRSLGRSQLRQIRLDLQDRLGVQHFDLVLLGSNPSAFARAVAPHAVPL